MTTLTAPRLERKRPLTSLLANLDSPVKLLPVVVLCALAIRLIVAAFCAGDIAKVTADHGDFGAEMGWVARALYLGRGYSAPFLPLTGPTALVPPLYPYLMAGVFKLFGLYTVQAAYVMLAINGLFSSLTCIPVFFSVRNVAGDRAARWATWGWALYPFAIYFSASQVWDYALTSLLFACCFWAAQVLHKSQRSLGWAAFGALFGITLLSNPSVLTSLPFLLLIAGWRVRRAGGPWIRRMTVAMVATIVVVLPWSIRNQRALHTAVPLRDGFWLEFYAGNHGDTSVTNPPEAHPASNAYEMKKWVEMGETAYLQEKHDLSMQFIKQHPVYFVEVTLRRTLRYWTSFWSVSGTYLKREPFDIPNWFFCTGLTLLMLRGIFRWVREDWRSSLPYLVLIVLFPIPYYLTHASMDYRQPIEPEVLALVVVGMVGLQPQESYEEELIEEDFDVEAAEVELQPAN